MLDRVNIDQHAMRKIAAILAAFVLAAAIAGVVWEWLWDNPVGLTYKGEWFLEPGGPDLAFQGVALYVLIAFPLGLLLAVLFGLQPRHELTTVVTVLVAAFGGAILMYAVGHALGPSNPQALAAGKPDFTPVPADLVIGSPTKGDSPFLSTALLAMPGGAMAGLVAVYLLGRKRIDEPARG